MRRVDAGADGGGAQVDFLDQATGLAQAGLVLANHHRVGHELLAQRHGHGILQLGAADLEHVLELACLGLEAFAQDGHGAEQAVYAAPQGQPHRGRVDVIGALRGVDMVVGVQPVVAALLEAELFQREVGDHLVGIHVGRGAGPALDDIDDELFVKAPGDQFLAGLDDGAHPFGVEHAEFGIGAGCGLLHMPEGADEVGHGRDRRARNGEILDRPGGVHAPVGRLRNLFFAKEIALDPGAGCHGRPES